MANKASVNATGKVYENNDNISKDKEMEKILNTNWFTYKDNNKTAEGKNQVLMKNCKITSKLHDSDK